MFFSGGQLKETPSVPSKGQGLFPGTYKVASWKSEARCLALAGNG